MITDPSHIADPLPTDVEVLQGMVRALRSALRVSTVHGERLEYKLRDLLRRMYGPKSEKLNPAQRLLFGILEELPPPPGVAGNEERASSGAKRKSRGGRQRKPENLPVRRRLIDLPPEKKQGLVKIREEIIEQIEYQPSRFYRLQLVRPVYAHPKKAHAPVVAALPPQVIPQAGVGPGFIAHVLTAKYVDHLPLHRQERIDARGGVSISRQARCRYVEAAALTS